MGGAPVDWVPGALVLALGLIAGLVVAVRARSARAAAASVEALPLEVRDLIGKRDVLIHQLQEMEDMAGKKTAGQLADERYALELDAARVLMELDERGKAAAPKAKRKSTSEQEPVAAATPGFLAERPALRGFLWGIGAMAALGGLVVSVRETATTRQEGGSLTGNTPMEGRPPMAAPGQSDEEAQLRATVERNPDDLDTRMSLVQVYLGRQDMMGVWNETKAILDRSPGNPRAIAYQALVRMAMGQGDVARSMLEKVIASNPDLIEGYLHLALVHMRSGRESDAEAVMARAAKRFPARAQMLSGLMAEMKRQTEAEGPAPVAGDADPHAALAASEPEPGSDGSPHPASAAAAASVEGSVEIDPSLAGSVASDALVFITARAAGQTSGPPAAVKRLPAAFPLRFQLSASDSMMGGELPERLRIEARVDSDGDPLTRDPTDPSARAESVAVGTRGLKLVLRR